MCRFINQRKEHGTFGHNPFSKSLSLNLFKVGQLRRSLPISPTLCLNFPLTAPDLTTVELISQTMNSSTRLLFRAAASHHTASATIQHRILTVRPGFIFNAHRKIQPATQGLLFLRQNIPIQPIAQCSKTHPNNHSR